MSNYYLVPKKTGLSGWTDTLKSVGGSVFNVFSAGEQAKGAAAAMQAQAAANASMTGGGGLGIQPMTILLLGGVGLGAFLLLRKKKTAP